MSSPSSSIPPSFVNSTSAPSDVPITPSHSPTPPPSHGNNLPLELKYEITHWILAALYLVPLVLCIIWRLKPLLQSIIFSFWQIVFVIMMLVGLVARMSFWVLQPLIYSSAVKVRQDINLYWNLIPGFFFFSCYLVILFLWMEIYHSDSESRRDFRWLFSMVVGIMFAVLIALIVADFAFFGQYRGGQKVPMPTNSIQTAIFLYDGTLYIVTSVGFIVYGLLFWWKFRGGNRQPLLQKMRFDILPRVKLLTALCGIIFTIKAILVIWADYGNWAPAHFWWLDLLYYSLLEVVPIVLMLLVFRPQKPTDPAPMNSLITERR